MLLEAPYFLVLLEACFLFPTHLPSPLQTQNAGMKLLLLNSFKANLVPQTVALNWTQLHTGPIGRSVCLVRLLVAAELFSDCALVIMAGSVLKNKTTFEPRYHPCLLF